MAQMIRKQIYIDADSERFLKERSKELGVTEAEVVRQALTAAKRQAVAEAEQRESDEKRLKALNDMLAYIREHRMRSSPSAGDSEEGWVFNRNELYEERMNRYCSGQAESAESSG